MPKLARQVLQQGCPSATRPSDKLQMCSLFHHFCNISRACMHHIIMEKCFTRRLMRCSSRSALDHIKDDLNILLLHPKHPNI